MRSREEIIAALTKEKDRLENELRKMREFHHAAWQEYGSELCSGEMSRDEKRLADRVVRLQMFLQQFDSDIEASHFTNSISQLNRGLAWHKEQKRMHEEQIEIQTAVLDLWKEMAIRASVEV